MAASSRHVGHRIQKNGRFLINSFEQLWGHRSLGWTSALRQQAAEANTESPENIVIPRKKTWSKEAVLEALAATVKRDPTRYHYYFQDDGYLSPKTATEFKLYYLSQESGKAAAKYFINNNPKLFTKDFAEPHIPCLMPEQLSPRLEDVSEESLKERISLRKVTAAVEMYDQLLQAGTAVSMETTHDLLDLICLYCDKDPDPDAQPRTEEMESGEQVRRKRLKFCDSLNAPKSSWKEDNNAERIFNLLPERDVRCYSALIQGMVKYEAYAKAFSMYTDLLNNRLTANIDIFNALILAAPEVRESYRDRWDLMKDLLAQMNAQKVQPDLRTFNNVLRGLRRCGTFGARKAPQVLSEMKALGIEPSLASFNDLLFITYRAVVPEHRNTDILHEVMSELEGKSFTCRDPDDVMFFTSAMKLCLDNRDLELSYKVQNLVEVGENWRLLGDPYQQSIYYGRFFNLVCVMESIDEVLKWYRRLIPSLYYPSIHGLLELMQTLDTENCLQLLPMIWKDIQLMLHDNNSELVEEALRLMARDTHSPEVQESFAACALEIKSVFDGERRRPVPQWSNSALTNVTALLLRANKTQQAWEALQLFKSTNRIPSEELLTEFLSACHGGGGGSTQRAVDLVQLAAACCLPATAKLAKQALAEFDLTEEQRAILSDLESAGESSD